MTKILSLLKARCSILCIRRLHPPRDDCAVRVQWFSSVDNVRLKSYFEENIVWGSDLFLRIILFRPKNMLQIFGLNLGLGVKIQFYRNALFTSNCSKFPLGSSIPGSHGV